MKLIKNKNFILKCRKMFEQNHLFSLDCKMKSPYFHIAIFKILQKCMNYLLWYFWAEK